MQVDDGGIFLHLPSTAYTHDGFRAWIRSDECPDKLRCSYLNGELYFDMTHETLETHALVKAAICSVLYLFTEKLDLGLFFFDGALITNKPAKVSNNPDAVFASFESLEAGRVGMGAATDKPGQSKELVGSPDMVLEVVSNSSVQKDTVKLRAAYHQAKIQEYWIVDARGEGVVLDILHWRKAGYVAAAKEASWQFSRVYGREFQLTRKAGRLGILRYSLRHRAKH